MPRCFHHSSAESSAPPRRRGQHDPLIFFELGAQSCWGAKSASDVGDAASESADAFLRRQLQPATAHSQGGLLLAARERLTVLRRGRRETRKKAKNTRAGQTGRIGGGGSLLAADALGRALGHLPPLVVPLPAHALPTQATLPRRSARSLGDGNR
ncbi:hypothetical protein MTO96_008722 [Rhipicephalus appendiculatus]